MIFDEKSELTSRSGQNYCITSESASSHVITPRLTHEWSHEYLFTAQLSIGDPAGRIMTKCSNRVCYNLSTCNYMYPSPLQTKSVYFRSLQEGDLYLGLHLQLLHRACQRWKDRIQIICVCFLEAED